MKNILADALYHALWAERALTSTRASLAKLGADDAAIKDAVAGMEHLYDCQKMIKQAMELLKEGAIASDQ